MIKVLIADDQALIRESLQIVLSAQPDISLVGVAGNGIEVLEAMKKEVPDVILMDILLWENTLFPMRSLSQKCLMEKLLKVISFHLTGKNPRCTIRFRFHAKNFR